MKVTHETVCGSFFALINRDLNSVCYTVEFIHHHLTQITNLNIIKLYTQKKRSGSDEKSCHITSNFTDGIGTHSL